ncbi:MAG: hypothetical protein ACK4HV_09335 [Parachlamydiaceae bacterium]
MNILSTHLIRGVSAVDSIIQIEKQASELSRLVDKLLILNVLFLNMNSCMQDNPLIKAI